MSSNFRSLDIDGFDLPLLQNAEPDSELSEEVIAYIANKLTDQNFQKQLTSALYGENKTLVLDNNISLEYLSAGQFSIVFKLEINNKVFVLKVANNAVNTQTINYMYEMMRIQKIQEELGEELKALGVFLPTYYFAGMNFCCKEMIEGKLASKETCAQIVPQLEELIEKFIEKQKSIQPDLWKDTAVDMRDMFENVTQKDIITTPDGKIYLIDPLTN